jgi:uncharacterized protein
VQIGATPVTRNQQASVPVELVALLRTRAASDEPGRLPREVDAFLDTTFDLHVGGRDIEWSEDELYVSLPRPGGDAWLAIDLLAGEAEYETTDRGWIAWFNDLHKGRNTGAGWNWFIDLFAIACLVFCLTGLCLLQLHARQRGATWPLVGAGVLIPLLLLLLLAH